MSMILFGLISMNNSFPIKYILVGVIFLVAFLYVAVESDSTPLSSKIILGYLYLQFLYYAMCVLSRKRVYMFGGASIPSGSSAVLRGILLVVSFLFMFSTLFIIL